MTASPIRRSATSPKRRKRETTERIKNFHLEARNWSRNSVCGSDKISAICIIIHSDTLLGKQFYFEPFCCCRKIHFRIFRWGLDSFAIFLHFIRRDSSFCALWFRLWCADGVVMCIVVEGLNDFTRFVIERWGWADFSLIGNWFSSQVSCFMCFSSMITCLSWEAVCSGKYCPRLTCYDLQFLRILDI